jgi:hypothetical protein
MLVFMPNVPQRSLTVVPALPKRWGTVVVTDLRLGEVSSDIEANGDRATIHHPP